METVVYTISVPASLSHFSHPPHPSLTLNVGWIYFPVPLTTENIEI